MRLYYRWFLAFVLTVIALIFLRNIYSETDDSNNLEEKPATLFKWIKFEGYTKCRNSVQGARTIVDDRGYMCERSDKLSSGCCFPDGITSKQFVCSSCLINNCCSIYEHCVSCCQHPNKQTLLRTILANNTLKILTRVGDQFEFCLAKCRTSSQSVIHENHYRNSKYKHCFGTDYPQTDPS